MRLLRRGVFFWFTRVFSRACRRTRHAAANARYNRTLSANPFVIARQYYSSSYSIPSLSLGVNVEFRVSDVSAWLLFLLLSARCLTTTASACRTVRVYRC